MDDHDAPFVFSDRDLDVCDCRELGDRMGHQANLYHPKLMFVASRAALLSARSNCFVP